MMKPERRISLTTGDMNTKDQRTRMEALKRPLQIFSRKSGKSRGKKKNEKQRDREIERGVIKERKRRGEVLGRNGDGFYRTEMPIGNG